MKHVGLGLISMSKLNKYVAYFRERQADIGPMSHVRLVCLFVERDWL